MDVTAALGPVVDALAADSVDLSRVGVVCDWGQYRSSFRDVVDIRPILAAHGADSALVPLAAVMAEDEMEVAIDVRRCWDVPLRELTGELLRTCGGDARNQDSMREIITGLLALGDSLAEPNALPEELYVDRDHARDYYPRPPYLMCDYSPDVWELARAAVADHAELIAHRILNALETFPADNLIINPDCGLRHLPADVARLKLAAMVKGTVAVRRTLPAEYLMTSSELTVEQGA